MTLTEQWKKGELPTGDYYVKPKNGQVFVYHINHSVKHIYHNHAGEIKEVLAPVPSYEEWQQLHKFLEEFNALEVAKENEQLKEKLEKAEATLLEIDGGWVTDEIRSKISEYFVYAIGEKK